MKYLIAFLGYIFKANSTMFGLMGYQKIEFDHIRISLFRILSKAILHPRWTIKLLPKTAKNNLKTFAYFKINCFFFSL